MRYTREKRKIKPAGYVALGVLALLVLGLILTLWNWVDQQFIHPYGYGIPTHLAATFTPAPRAKQSTPTAAATAAASLSGFASLPPLATATPPGAATKSTATITVSPTTTRAVGIPWAGKVTPGQPVPDEVIQSITASWQEMWKTLYDYQSVKTNGKPDDKTWWTEQARRFFTGAALTEQLHNIEGWFKPGASGGPGFIENGRYTLTVRQCTSDTGCLVTVNVQSGQWWAYDVAEKQFSKANAVQPFQWRAVFQYDLTGGQWKFKESR